jgi:hypothetical protein
LNLITNQEVASPIRVFLDLCPGFPGLHPESRLNRPLVPLPSRLPSSLSQSIGSMSRTSQLSISCFAQASSQPLFVCERTNKLRASSGDVKIPKESF